MELTVITVGKTHSGKTTFGFELSKKLKNSIVLDSDILADFLGKSYPGLYKGDFEDNGKDLSSGYDLKLSVMTEILKHALKSNLLIISTAANSTKRLRRKALLLSRKAGRKLLIVYFNRDENILLERIKTTERRKNSKNHIKEFSDLLLVKQKDRFENPSPKEADYFFEVKNNKGWADAILNIKKLSKR